MSKCTQCNSRKGKRNCPGTGSLICSQCCGTRREKEIKCPADCSYLEKSGKYFAERSEVRRITDFEREIKTLEGDEEAYTGILENMESAIHKKYKEEKNITDRDVEAALEYFIDAGKAKLDLPVKSKGELAPNVQAIVDALETVLDFKASLSGESPALMNNLKYIRHILDAVNARYDSKDSCGYLNFMSEALK